MAFERPALSDIITRVKADFVSRLELEGAVLRRSAVAVLARVVAGAAHMLHGHLDYVSRQIFPDLSDDANLVRQAALYGITKTAPTYATATVEFTGDDGEIIPAGSLLVRSDGAEYETDADGTIAAGVVEIEVTALVAGADGTLDVGTSLSLESPISGVTSTAEVIASTSDGTDQETTGALRVRLLARLADPVHGGTEADYVAWAKEVSGVTRVWVTPFELGPGTVVVRFARDNDASPIPDAGEVTVVQTAIDLVKPAHASVTVHAPTDAPVDFEISVTPDTVAVRSAVEAELEDLLLREAEPGGTVLLSTIRTAIGTATGVTDYSLTDPVADLTFTTNQLPSLGTITWI